MPFGPDPLASVVGWQIFPLRAAENPGAGHLHASSSEKDFRCTFHRNRVGSDSERRQPSAREKQEEDRSFE
jgi:hypothetical protein